MSAAPEVIDAALRYMESGLYIVAVRDKKPLDKDWRRQFSKQEIIERLQGQSCNGFGFLGGDLNDHIVPLDFDTEAGEAWWQSQCEAAGIPPDDFPTVVTPGKIKDGKRTPGRHRYVADGRGTLGNSQGALKQLGIDVRGSGHAMLPPSPHPDGGTYRWLERHSLDDFDAIPACPDFVYEAINTRLHKAETQSEKTTADESARRYCRTALDNEIIALARTASNRNIELNNCALKLGSLHHYGAFSEAEVIAALRGACEQNGLLGEDGLRAFEATFKSGWNAGLERPRTIEPQREKRRDGLRVAFDRAAEDGDGQPYAQADQPKPSQEPAPRLSQTISDFLAIKAEPRKPILRPWLMARGSGMIHAWRGVGKTQVAIGITVAAASGGRFLRWDAPEPCRVLFVDGEMPVETMQERFRAAVDACPPIPSGDYLRILTPDRLPDGRTVPNLLTLEGQAALAADLEGRDLVVFDNVATLFRSTEDQNAAGGWLAAQDYILALRRRGIAVLLIDHDNKAGGNRGTSAKHDVLDTVIHLSRPSDYREAEGARFNVEFSKARGFWGRDAAPFEAKMIDTGTGIAWAVADASDVMLDRVAQMVRDGMKERDIRTELGIGGSKLSRLKIELENRGKENG